MTKSRSAMLRFFRFVVLFLPIVVASSFQMMIRTHHPMVLSATDTSTDTATRLDTVTSSSNLSLLEHVNFNVPDHEYILDFYLDLLGCGLDPKVGVNLMDENDQQFGREGLIWVSCGPNQFHFPRCRKDETAQVLHGHLGLRYQSLEHLVTRLERASTSRDDSKCFASYDIATGSDGETVVQIRDRYGNVFHCREGPDKQRQYTQSVVQRDDDDTLGDVALRYGVANEQSECRGIDYVEFDCRPNTANIIATFYASVLDATTHVQEDRHGRTAAYISIGDIDPTTGAAAQQLIFRETPREIPAYDGHHIALYIGTTNTLDFERAFAKAEKLGLLSTNWRDKVDVMTLEDARSQSQFRIESILDLATGESVFRLEHEFRSIHHPTWPGAK